MKISLAEAARVVGGTLKGDADKQILGAAPFDGAGPDEITWAGSARFLKKIGTSMAGVIIVPIDFCDTSHNIIQAANPELAFAGILNHLYPALKPTGGISPSACIGDDFCCGSDCFIAPGVVIGNGVVIGDRVTLHPNVVLGDHVTMGDDVVICPNVTIIEKCIIGSRVRIDAGTVIGSDGFGFATDGEKYVKIPQLGIVQIDDDVEIGAGNTIDRAAFGRTWICRGVKTDNLVHVAHNVTVGEDTVIVAQVGIAGSTSLGKHVILAGQAGIAGHIEIGDHAIVGPQSGVARSIAPGHVVSGTLEMPHRQWLRVQRTIPKLPELAKMIEEMKKRLAEIEKKYSDRAYEK
jgi:UDP-3-O-[3-hydroxymyristoyl] glucosamine N-acyltransferase